MACDNEQKLDELSRKLGVQEEELKRAIERAELAESKLKGIEEELQMVGENMKQLEKSAEKALEREEKLVEKIYNLQSKYKTTEARFEYGEMNITKLNQRIDDIEDEIYREKLKIKKCSDELDSHVSGQVENDVAVFGHIYAICQIPKIYQMKFVTEFVHLHEFVFFPIGNDDMVALRFQFFCNVRANEASTSSNAAF